MAFGSTCRVVCSLAVALALAACVASAPKRADEPALDNSFNGVVSLARASGQRAGLLAASVEQAYLKAYPSARWVDRGDVPADLVLDLAVQDVRLQDKPHTREDRNCRRYSEPDAKAKTVLEKMISRKCLDWEVRNVPCLSRQYEVDLIVRGFRGTGGALVLSQRKVLSGEKRACGSETPSVPALQLEVEAQAGPWVLELIRPHLQDRNRVSSVAPALASGARVAVPVTAPAPALAPTPAVGSAPLAAPTPVVAPTAASAMAPVPGLPGTLASTRIPVRAHALVIGNGAYPGSGRLVNPVNDARLVSERLSALGFAVTRVEDADRETLVRTLAAFRERAASSDLTLLYYSGHGMQIDGVNFMVPIDAPMQEPQSMRLRALPVADLIEAYLPGKTRLVFLDACRDNPVLASGTRGFTRGLAPMRVPEGTLIAYATKDGGVAEDGTGQRNSPFTTALVEHLGDPDDIVIVLRRVREKVMRATQGRQQPWDYGALTGGALVLSALKPAP